MRESEKGYAKEAWKNLTFKQKVRQFKDYYLIYTVIAVIVIAFLAGIVKTVFFEHEENVLALAIFEDVVDQEKLAEFETVVRDAIDDHDESHLILIRDGYNTDDYQMVMVFTVFVAGQAVDVVLADSETFSHYASQGMFFELSEYLTEEELELWKDRIYETAGQAPQDSVDPLSTEEQPAGEVRPYGLKLQPDSMWYDYSVTMPEDYVVGIIANTKCLDNALTMLRMLM